MHILLTNDDGIQALGIKTLAKHLIKAGHTVNVVAPMRQQSGVSQCLTIFDPLRTKHHEEENYHGIGVYGTPADCVKLALGSLMEHQPDCIVSGLNMGANVGPDLFYSGTVAAAIEGSQQGFPSIALSLDNHNPSDVNAQCEHAVRLLAKLPLETIPKKRVLNINYPDCPIDDIKGIRVCANSEVTWDNVYQGCTDPRGERYYWLIGARDESKMRSDSDIILLRNKYITITPLRFEFTDQQTMKLLNIDSL